MRPTLIMACSIWLTMVLCIVIGAMAHAHLDFLGVGLMAVVTFYLLAMAIQFTRCYLRGIPFPFVDGGGIIGHVGRRRTREGKGRSPR